MTGNCRIFEITEEPDETLRWILLEAARNIDTVASLPVGYPKTLNGELSRFISLLPGLEETDRVEPGPLFRLYASISEEETFALLCGETSGSLAEKTRATFPRAVRSAERTLADGKAYLERDWGLIGLAIPGWVILFSEDVTTACQDDVEGGIRAAFLPAVDEWLSRIGPEAGDGEVLSLLLVFFMNSLPDRER